MRKMYIPPGHLWVIEMAETVARWCYPEHWTPESMLPGEEGLWNNIVTNDYKPELVLFHLQRQFPQIDWSVFSPHTARYFTYDDALDVLRMLIAEGFIQAKFVDAKNQGAIDHIASDMLRTKAGLHVLQQGYAFLADDPGILHYIFLSHDAVYKALVAMGRLQPPSPRGEPEFASPAEGIGEFEIAGNDVRIREMPAQSLPPTKKEVESAYLCWIDTHSGKTPPSPEMTTSLTCSLSFPA